MTFLKIKIKKIKNPKNKKKIIQMKRLRKPIVLIVREMVIALKNALKIKEIFKTNNNNNLDVLYVKKKGILLQTALNVKIIKINFNNDSIYIYLIILFNHAEIFSISNFKGNSDLKIK